MTLLNRNRIIVFADGASSGNPGPGGWGSILVFPDGSVRELGGRDEYTTNNRMELLATISALQAIPTGETPIEMYTDSTYVIRGITQWIWGWLKRNWLTTEGKEVLNAELWKTLFSLSKERKIQWHYVRGHSGIPGNERADEIAVHFSQKKSLKLYQGSLSNYSVSIEDIPKDTSLPDQKSPISSKSKKPYSYLSLVGNLPRRHPNWEECEKRVKGISGAKFKKALTPDDEIETLRSWGYRIEDLK